MEEVLIPAKIPASFVSEYVANMERDGYTTLEDLVKAGPELIDEEQLQVWGFPRANRERLLLLLKSAPREVTAEYAAHTLQEMMGAEAEENALMQDVYNFAGRCKVLFSFGSGAGGLHLSMRLKQFLDSALKWGNEPGHHGDDHAEKRVYIDAVNLGLHPKRREIREPLDWAQRKCSSVAGEVDESDIEFLKLLSNRLRDKMVLYEADADGRPMIERSEEEADRVWAEVKNDLDEWLAAKRAEKGCEWLAALDDTNAPMGGIPFTRKLNPNWAQYYYMASLSMTTCVVVLDEAWLSSLYCEGEWNVFHKMMDTFMDGKERTSEEHSAAYDFELVVIYDNTSERPRTEESVRARLTELGFPKRMQDKAVMHGTDIRRFLPTKEDPHGWESQKLDGDLEKMLCEKVEEKANRCTEDWGGAEAREQVYKHLFLRDWERLAVKHAADPPEPWWRD